MKKLKKNLSTLSMLSRNEMRQIIGGYGVTCTEITAATVTACHNKCWSNGGGGYDGCMACCYAYACGFDCA